MDLGLAETGVVPLGCMAPPYEPPGSGPRAALTIARATGATSGRLFSYLFDGGVGVDNSGLSCKGKVALEPIEFDSSESRVTQLVAGRRTHLILTEFNK